MPRGFFLRAMYSSSDDEEYDFDDDGVRPRSLVRQARQARREIEQQTQEALVANLVSMGFDEQKAAKAVEIFEDDVQSCTEWLLRQSSLGSMPQRFKRDYEFKHTFYNSRVNFNNQEYVVRDYDPRYQIILVTSRNHTNGDAQWISLSEPLVEWIEEIHDEIPEKCIKMANCYYHSVGRLYMPKHAGFEYNSGDNPLQSYQNATPSDAEERVKDNIMAILNKCSEAALKPKKIEEMHEGREYNRSARENAILNVYLNGKFVTFNQNQGWPGWRHPLDWDSRYIHGHWKLSNHTKCPQLTSLWAAIMDTSSHLYYSKIKPVQPREPVTVNEFNIRHYRCKAYTKIKLILEIKKVSHFEVDLASTIHDINVFKRQVNNSNTLKQEDKLEILKQYEWFKNTRAMMRKRREEWFNSVLPCVLYSLVEENDSYMVFDVNFHDDLFNATQNHELNTSITKNIQPIRVILEAIEMGEDLLDPIRAYSITDEFWLRKSKQEMTTLYNGLKIALPFSVPKLGELMLDFGSRTQFGHHHRDIDLYPHQKELFEWMVGIEKMAHDEKFLPLGWEKCTATSGYVYYKHVLGKILSNSKWESCINNRLRDKARGGGIIAQAVGSGKTKTVLKVIEHMKSEPEWGTPTQPPKHPMTLVVVPTTMLSTWESECRKWTPDLIMCTYHGNRRRLDNRADIVLTTYRTVTTECSLNAPAVKHDDLHFAIFDRIVLDEGHHIRDINSKLYEALGRLSLTHYSTKWVITATPIVKNVFDLSAYLHWIGEMELHMLARCDCPSVYLNHLLSWMESQSHSSIWHEMYKIIRGRLFYQTKDMVTAMSNLSSPTIEEEVVTIDSTNEALYSLLVKNIKKNMASNPHHARGMRLRYVNWMRICAYNPSWVPFCAYGSPLTRVTTSGVKVEQHTTENLTLDGASESYEANLKSVLKDIDQQKCPICLDCIERPAVTSCGHLFCSECINNSFNSSQGKKCPLCRTMLNNTILKEILPKEQLEKESDGMIIIKHDTLGSHEIRKEDYDALTALEKKVPAKISKLLSWFEENDGKCLIFTSLSTRITNDIHTHMEKAGIGHVIVSGNMTKRQRGQAIHTFQTDDNVRAFLLTARSASYGLTLTAASTVIFFEPCMNRSLRKQCIGRMDRLGQKKNNLKVITYTVKDSIEEKLERVLRTRNWNFKDVGL